MHIFFHIIPHFCTFAFHYLINNLKLSFNTYKVLYLSTLYISISTKKIKIHFFELLFLQLKLDYIIKKKYYAKKVGKNDLNWNNKLDFSGEYICKLDSKNRLVLPAKLRDKLPEQSRKMMKLRKGFEPCLELLPLETYQTIIEKFEGLNKFNAKHRKFERNFLSGIYDIDLNENCRFLIPKNLVNLTNLNREVTLIGLNGSIEIWNTKTWSEVSINESEDFNNLAEEVMQEINDKN